MPKILLAMTVEIGQIIVMGEIWSGVTESCDTNVRCSSHHRKHLPAPYLSNPNTTSTLLLPLPLSPLPTLNQI